MLVDSLPMLLPNLYSIMKIIANCSVLMMMLMMLVMLTGDEINSPDGDAYEAYRIVFDLTFFFFVIVILLAIIQGMYSV